MTPEEAEQYLNRPLNGNHLLHIRKAIEVVLTEMRRLRQENKMLTYRLQGAGPWITGKG